MVIHWPFNECSMNVQWKWDWIFIEHSVIVQLSMNIYVCSNKKNHIFQWNIIDVTKSEKLQKWYKQS